VNTDPLVVLVVIVALGALGAVAVLGRMAMERRRLVVRYDHIKTVMAREQQLRAKRQKAQSSIARPAALATGEGDADVAVVKAGSPVAEG